MKSILNKLDKIIDKREKPKLIILIVLMIVGALLETLGISLIIPLVSVVTDERIFMENPNIRFICGIFHITSVKGFALLVIFSLALLYIIKNVYLLFEYKQQYRFIYRNRFHLQKKFLEFYLHRPYEQFLYSSTAEVVRVVTSDVTQVFSLMTNVMQIFTEGALCLMLVFALMLVDPVITILMGFLLVGVMVLINLSIKPVLQRAGKNGQIFGKEMNKWMLQSVAGIKEIKVAGKEYFFLDRFSWFGKKAIDTERKNAEYRNVPRLMIESISMAGILLVIGLLVLSGRELTSMIPQLSAFAMAAVRLMPSANRVSTSLTAISYQEPSLDKIIENLEPTENREKMSLGTKTEEIKPMMFQDSLVLDKVTYCYPGDNKKVLEAASMMVPARTSVGIVGESGAGKTTVVDLILGLLIAESGKILVDGQNIMDNYSGWLACIGYIPQSIYLMDDTIKANVAFGISDEQADDKKIWDALDEAKLGEFVRSLPKGLYTEIGEQGVRLSGGQRQRIGIARALYSKPQLLIFDEATSALDNETETAIMESINQLRRKNTMIIIAHRLTTIEGCDMVYRVKNGKIELERK